MPACGFGHLPTDIILEILQTWIGGGNDKILLQTLSALDKACCSRSLRRSVLDMASRLSFSCGDDSYEALVAKPINYVSWMRSRGVRVKTVFVTDKQALTRILGLSGDIRTLGHVESIVSNVIFQPALLAGLHVTCICLLAATSAALVEQTLELIGTHCKHLQKIKIKYRKGLRMDKVANLVAVLPDLVDVSLADYYHNEGDGITQILHAGRKRLKRFATEYSCGYAELAGLLEMHSWLDAFLILGSHSCSGFDRFRNALELSASCASMNLNALDRILAVCPDVVQLKLTGGWTDQEACLMRLTDRYALTLQHLTITLPATPFQEFKAVLSCKMLQTLIVTGVDMSDTDLQQLARNCPLLRVLRLSMIFNYLTMTDAGMRAVFAGCGQLKVVAVVGAKNLTFDTLQGILDCKLHLVTFVWCGLGNFHKDHVARFNQLAKDIGLFPVPEIVDAEHRSIR